MFFPVSYIFDNLFAASGAVSSCLKNTKARFQGCSRMRTDAQGFADGAARILSDPARAARMGERGRSLAKSLSWERVVRETEAVYEQVQAS